MHTAAFLYIASVLGAVSLLLILPKGAWNLPRLGAVLGVAAVGGLWVALGTTALAGRALGEPWSQFAYYYVFSALSIIAAVRVITHTRPVYAALWFVMVVLASGGLLLTLSAQFIAFAMVIIYGGAILVTYLFVIMLASQQSDLGEEDAQPGYDRLAREPIAAVGCGFLLLAMLLVVMFPVGGLPRHQEAAGPSDAQLLAHTLTRRPPGVPMMATTAPGTGPGVSASGEAAAHASQVTNTQHIGLDLFTSHPLGLELAGVILLVSLIGAVVIAKTHVPDEEAGPPAEAGEIGATSDEPGPHQDRGTGNVPHSVSP